MRRIKELKWVGICKIVMIVSGLSWNYLDFGKIWDMKEWMGYYGFVRLLNCLRKKWL